MQNRHQVLHIFEAPQQVLQGHSVKKDKQRSVKKDQLWKDGQYAKAGLSSQNGFKHKQKDNCNKESTMIWLIALSSQWLLREGQMLAVRIGITVGWKNTILGSSAVPNRSVCIHGSQSTKDRVTRVNECKENINTNHYLTLTHSYLMLLAFERKTFRFLFYWGILT